MKTYIISRSKSHSAYQRLLRLVLTGCLALLMPDLAIAQHLKPGFDSKEYLDMLAIDFLHADTPWTNNQIVPPEHARLMYRSPETGLHNRWDLWLRDDQTAVISIRGTVGNKESWMENFFAGMIPASGQLQLNDSTIFKYRLAKEDKAFVHAGWTLALASMAPDIVKHIKELHQKGIKEFLISGHSQGGAICFLLRSYLQYLDDPDFPKDVIYKTYCSAAPKPGNLYYAYDFDYITRNGWGFRVVNTRDWVPETPFSLQTTNDFNTPNPFMNVKDALKKQNIFIRLIVGGMYNKLDRSSKKASRRMQKMLGKRLSKLVKKSMPEYVPPPFVESHAYSPAGTPVILYPDAAYDSKHVFDGKNIFLHHMYMSYKELVERIYQE
ncbi:lipase family protein [Chitinophaga rhizophila]|uniref:Lipase family protein n=1 Tax=Chitinophaga rhizophila TaxID=2866212 RepID=A0ABS7GA93_9BACT|nr:lipase family protein [Chitinophaga rhizophila]MBW8684581.1 lipase family protein [Chitinophaga rhizophila]